MALPSKPGPVLVSTLSEIQELRVKKGYWVLLILTFLVALDWYIRAPDGRSRELTGVIQQQGSQDLKDYPYQFKVVKVEGETAYLSTPRNVQVPALKAIGAMFPDINTKDANNPEFIAAEKRLAKVQGEAQDIIKAQPGIKSVQWTLDTDWLKRHFIEIPEK